MRHRHHQCQFSFFFSQPGSRGSVHGYLRFWRYKYLSVKPMSWRNRERAGDGGSSTRESLGSGRYRYVHGVGCQVVWQEKKTGQNRGGNPQLNHPFGPDTSRIQIGDSVACEQNTVRRVQYRFSILFSTISAELSDRCEYPTWTSAASSQKVTDATGKQTRSRSSDSIRPLSPLRSPNRQHLAVLRTWTAYCSLDSGLPPSPGTAHQALLSPFGTWLVGGVKVDLAGHQAARRPSDGSASHHKA